MQRLVKRYSMKICLQNNFSKRLVLIAVISLGCLIPISRPSWSFDEGVFGEIRFDIESYALNILKAGNGSGTVMTSKAGINCGSDCGDYYDEDSSATLTATPSSGSLFSGWSGDCSGSGTQTTVTMSDDITCIATFTSIPPTIIYVNKNDSTCDGKYPCYTSIHEAVEVAATRDEIRIAQGDYTFLSPITVSGSKSVTLKGGWNSAFTSQTAKKTFIKSPTVSQGSSVTLQMLNVVP